MMRLTHHFAVWLFALLLLTPTAAHADGWPQGKGKGYYKLGLGMMRATHYYAPGGNKIRIPTLGDYVVSLYAEHGLTERLTVTAYVPIMERITLNRQEGRETGTVFFEGDAVSGVADAEVGVRFGLWQEGGTALSAAAKLGLPLGQSEQENGLLTGDGELNQQLGLELGHSFWPAPVYATAAVAFNNRVRGFSDEVVYKLEAGYTVARAFTISVRGRGVASMDNGDAGNSSATGLYANNQSYLSFGAEASYATRSGVGVAASVDTATRAENVLAAPLFTVGVFLKR